MYTKELLIVEFVILWDALWPSSGAVYLSLSWDNSEGVTLTEDNEDKYSRLPEEWSTESKSEFDCCVFPMYKLQNQAL